MTTLNSRITVVDLDGMSAAAATTAVNAAIETLEASGFVVTGVDYEVGTRGGLPILQAFLTGLLPEYAGDPVGLIRVMTFDVVEGDITTAGAAETINFDESLPEGCYPLGVRVGVSAIFTGGTISDYTVDVGFAADVDALVDGADLFSAAVDGEAATVTLDVSPHKFVTGSAAARLPSATFRCGSDDVADATAGACRLTIIYMIVPVKVLSFTVKEADITAAAATEVLAFDEALPEGAYPLGVRIGVSPIFTGGTISDYTCDVGFTADMNALVDGADLFSAAVDGEAATVTLGVSPHKFITGTVAARTPRVTFDCGSDDVADATAGKCKIDILYI